jgi:hypothetical protein
MSKLDLVGKVELAVSLCGDARFSDAQVRTAVALLFVFHNTETGACYPSLAQLGEASCTSKRTAVRTVQKLRAFGYGNFESTAGGRNKRNTYSFKRVSPAHPLTSETVSPAHPLEGETVPPAHPRGATSAPLTVPPAHPLLTQEVNTGIKHRKGRARNLSDDEKFTARHQEIATEFGVAEAEARAEFEKFKDYHIGHGTTWVDWTRAWRTWCRNSLQFAAREKAKERGEDQYIGGLRIPR